MIIIVIVIVIVVVQLFTSHHDMQNAIQRGIHFTSDGDIGGTSFDFQSYANSLSRRGKDRSPGTAAAAILPLTNEAHDPDLTGNRRTWRIYIVREVVSIPVDFHLNFRWGKQGVRGLDNMGLWKFSIRYYGFFELFYTSSDYFLKFFNGILKDKRSMISEQSIRVQ
ncbi:hypothetical protein M0802_010913 [Mischocyttarus mexicanus]|nr:hypothetical protein M0802_010913 [Mischocyttarus mexicanus]